MMVWAVLVFVFGFWFGNLTYAQQDRVDPPVRVQSQRTVKLASAQDVPQRDVAPQAPVARLQPASKTNKRAAPRGWVKPVDIVKRLEVLKSIGVTQQWAEETEQLVGLLVEEKEVHSHSSGVLLEQLATKLPEVEQIGNVVQQRFPDLPASINLVSELRRLRYDMTKRLMIWQALNELELPVASDKPTYTLASEARLSFDQFDPAWKEYLRLDKVTQSFNAINSDAKGKKASARAALVRLYSPTLDTHQSQFVHQLLSRWEIELLRNSASDPVDHYELLRAIEKYERKPSGVAAHYINDQFQNLLWSTERDNQQVAALLQTHFRNANIRLTVSDRMLNRLIPSSPSIQQPVNERVLGARVNGNSEIHNTLSVQLIPDPTRLHLELKTNGHVDSDTTARKSGFEVRNSGKAKFQAFKRFAIDRFGNLDGQSSIAHAKANQRIVGVRSNLDSLPIVNWIARRIARKKIAQQAPQANMLLEQKVEGSARQQLEEGVHEKVNLMQANLKTNLLEPLVAMDLDPEAIQTATTDHRLVMRYRLAGLDQMAANSPRPMDSENDYMGVQVHQSLLNNMIERIDIASESFTPETLMSHLADVIGFNPESNQEGSKQHEAEFEFANYDPIRIDLQDGMVRIELNLKSLKVGKKGKTWRNITISSNYQPEVQGAQIRLTQASPVKVKGRRFRLGDQIAVRAIFTVVLPKQYTFDTVPKRLNRNMNGFELVIEQLSIADGWVGITFNETPALFTPSDTYHNGSHEVIYGETVIEVSANDDIGSVNEETVYGSDVYQTHQPHPGFADQSTSAVGSGRFAAPEPFQHHHETAPQYSNQGHRYLTR